jgi:hypothetical protein
MKEIQYESSRTTPAEMITKVWILRGMAEGIQKAAEAAEDEAQKTTLSKEDEARELRVAELLIESCQKLTEGVVSIWNTIRAFIRAGELGERDLLTTERILKRFFRSGEFTFTTVRGLIQYLQAHRLTPPGVAEFEAAASRLAAAREEFAKCYADLKDSRLQQSIQRGFDEAMRTTGEPWDWKQELFGGEGK